MSPHPSTLTLHRLRYGELDAEAETALRAHLATCEACNGRLAVQLRERAAFVVRPVPVAIRELATPPVTRRRWTDLFPFALGAAAAALLFVAVLSLRTSTGPAPADAVAYRGSLPTVEAWIDQGRGARVLRDTDVLGAGDRIQLTYDPLGASYIAIAGRDGTGTIEVYTTNAPTGVGLVQAPFSLTLDGVPGVQELFVVGSDAPLDEREVKTAVVSDVPSARVARIAVRKREGSR